MASRRQVRGFQSYIRALTPEGTKARIPLKSTRNGVFGLSISRGTRAYQEDTASATCVHIDPNELRNGYLRSPNAHTRAIGEQWDAQKAGGDELAGQVVWFGCFDGHGGQNVSLFLRDQLHRTFEDVQPDMVTDTVQYTRELGGYFRRFNGGLLERWARKEELKPVRAGNRARPPPPSTRPQSEEQEAPKTFAELVNSAKSQPSLVHSQAQAGATPSAGPVESAQPGPTSSSSSKGPPVLSPDSPAVTHGLTRRIPPPAGMEKETLTMAERLTLAWLVADRQIQADATLDVGGSTASVALLHSLDVPSQPYYASSRLSLTTAHIGDTRMLLCATKDGRAIPLTNYHHPDDRAESERLRKMGAGMITDSFGEARWMGALANTRAFGDSGFKKVGVTAEPEVISQVINGDDYAFLIGFSDGLGGVMSDQEAVDLCRGARHPSEAAQSVLRFAEELGAQDNGTVLVVPLKGWGRVGGEDTTKERREFRRSKVDLYRDSRI